MKVDVPPTAVDRSNWPFDAEMDGLLRASYHAEMPNPWPAAPVPASRVAVLPLRTSARRSPQLRTRLALAASVAFLVAGPLALSAFFHLTPSDARTTEPAGTTVADPNLYPHIEKKFETRETYEQKHEGTAIKVEVNDHPSK